MSSNVKKFAPLAAILALAAAFHFVPVLFKKPELEKPTTLSDLTSTQTKK